MKRNYPGVSLRRSLLSMALSLCAVVPALAADEQTDALIVNFHDGTQAFYLLDARPIVTFEDANLCVQSANDNDVHEFVSVDTFTFGVYTSVSSVESDMARIVCRDNYMVEFTGFAEGTQVMVSNLAGQLLSHDTVAAGGMVTVSLAQYGAGVYIISTSSGQTLKIVKS